MPPRRRLPPNAEIAVRAHMEPVLLKGGETVKSLSTAFLADLEEDWRAHGKKVFPVLREKYPQAYFGGLVALAKMIRWETAEEMLSDGGMTPDEIMDKLEQRVGPEGRKLFEDFLRKVNTLQAKQLAERESEGEDFKKRPRVGGLFRDVLVRSRPVPRSPLNPKNGTVKS
jgi:hypothetical protein